MSKIIDYIISREDFVSGKRTNMQSIIDAEKKLNLMFSDEYKECLLHCGAFGIDGHEFTGITESERLNVENVTMRMRLEILNMPECLYVLEETNIDDRVILQDQRGIIYEASAACEPRAIYTSFLDYLKQG